MSARIEQNTTEQEAGTPPGPGAPSGDPVQGTERGLRYDELWLSSFFRPLLITLLIGCIDVALVGFLRHIIPGMPVAHAQLLVLLGVLSSLVGGYTTTLLIRPDQRERRTTGYRLAELGLLLFLVRVITWSLIEGWPSLAAVIYEPLSVLLTGVFILTTVLVFLSWGAAVYVTKQFLEMALRPDELAERPSDRYRTIYDSRMRSDRRSLLSRFTEFWILGGVFLLLLTAGSQFGPSSTGFFAISRQNIAPAVISAGVIYFLTGFVLIAIGRLAVLRAQWQIEEVEAAESIARNWPVYALGLVAIMGLVAILLPLGGTFWLAQILGFIIQAVYFVVYFVFGLLMALFTSLLPGGEESAPAPEMAPMAPPVVEAAAQPAEVAPWLGGTLFWITMALLLGYAAYIYLSGKGFNFDRLKQWWDTLRLRWLAFWGAYGEWRRSAQRPLSEEQPAEADQPGWLRALSRLRLRGRNPTEQVRFFYLSMLEQAAARGVVRGPGETPSQFAPRLEREVVETAEDATHLTQAFVQVHYATHEADEAQIPFLQQVWQRIRKALH